VSEAVFYRYLLVGWTALAVRLIERACGASWAMVRQEMDRLHRGVFEGPDGQFVQRTDLTQKTHLRELSGRKAICDRLKLGQRHDPDSPVVHLDQVALHQPVKGS
jgi:hypothetical protein